MLQIELCLKCNSEFTWTSISHHSSPNNQNRIEYDRNRIAHL